MRCSFPWEEGGGATGVLITDKSHEPGGDESLLGERIRTENVTLEMGDSN